MEASGSAPLRLLILQPTPFCNIGCDYCYLTDRANSRRMPLQVVKAAIENARDSGLLGEDLSVVWHAGEPLTVPVRFYRESFEMIRAVVPARTRLMHCIQTNGLLIDDPWCELFREWNVRVGVSLDGPAFLHDAHRKTRDGRPTHHHVMEGVERLRKYGLPFHVIAVITRDSLGYAAEILDFFCRNGITEVGFNIDESEGANARCTLEGREDDYREFMRRVLDVGRTTPIEFHIREIQNAMQVIRRGLPEVRVGEARIPYNSQVLAGVIISVDYRGGFSTFSPELLDQTHPRYESFQLGNVLQHSIREALRSLKATRIQEDILRGVEACRRDCEYFGFCGGGSPVNKLSENGSFESTETLYCRCAIQTPFVVALEALEAALHLNGRVARGVARNTGRAV